MACDAVEVADGGPSEGLFRGFGKDVCIGAGGEVAMNGYGHSDLYSERTSYEDSKLLLGC